MLTGIRIVDFTRYLPGPVATQRLAQMGAEVVKIEPPRHGDPARVLDPSVFLANNRGKKSVLLNLHEQEGQELAFELARQADVVIEGFRPGVAEALGIGYERLREARADLIYCSLSGYGQTGPLQAYGGHDLNYLAWSGALSQFKDREGRVIQPGLQVADLVGGIKASEQILAALVKRSLTGEGSYLDVSLAGAVRDLMNTHELIEQTTGYGCGIAQLSGVGERGGVISYSLYDTADGRTVALGALEPKFWLAFCHGVGREDWVAAHLSPASEENAVFLQVRELFKSRTLLQWTQFARDVDCCLAPVLEVHELEQREHGAGEAPALGQDTQAFLQSLI